MKRSTDDAPSVIYLSTVAILTVVGFVIMAWREWYE